MRTRTRQTVTATLPDLFPDCFPGFPDAPQGVPPLTARAGQHIGDLLASDDFETWTETLARVGNCAKPIRLSGQSATVDTTTGDILSTHASAEEPLGVTHVRCGNRRARECPSCSRLYAADMFHLIRAGVTEARPSRARWPTTRWCSRR